MLKEIYRGCLYSIFVQHICIAAYINNAVKHFFYFLCREVPGLTSIHTLFVLEHNRIAKMLRAAGITEEDDKIYEVTRRYYDLYVVGPRAKEKYHIQLPSIRLNMHTVLVNHETL